MSVISDRIDELEFAMQDMPPVDCPVTHNFIPGFYIRTVTMPTDVLITSRIHNTEHPFFVSKGVAHVKVNDGEWEEIAAPYAGVTFPGTRRVLYIESECVWSTFHFISDDEQPELMLEEEVTMAVERIAERIIVPHENKLLGGVVKNNVVTKVIQNENY
jgi:hypothetical protein